MYQIYRNSYKRVHNQIKSRTSSLSICSTCISSSSNPATKKLPFIFQPYSPRNSLLSRQGGRRDFQETRIFTAVIDPSPRMSLSRDWVEHRFSLAPVRWNEASECICLLLLYVCRCLVHRVPPHNKIKPTGGILLVQHSLAFTVFVAIPLSPPLFSHPYLS